MMINTDMNGYNSLTAYNSVNSVYKSLGKNNQYGNLLKIGAQTGMFGAAGKANRVNQNMQKYVTGISGASKDLKAALNSLTSTNAASSVFSQKTAVSSNNAKLSVSLSGVFARDMQKTTVKIDQIATGQANKGGAMNAGAKTGLSGLQQVEIGIGGQKYQVSFNANSGESNKAVQQKMADAINKKGIGLSATVTEDEKGNSTLTVQSQNTGNSVYNKFTLNDVTGGAVSATGTGEATQQAQDAVFRVNGGSARTSKSNNVYLGNGINATLVQASDEEITISPEIDTENAVKQVQGLVDSFNNMLSAADGNSGSIGASRLRGELSNISKSYSSSLSRVGINVNSSGYMSVDKTKISGSAKSGALEMFFKSSGNANYGFSSQLRRVSSEAGMFSSKYTAGNAFSSMYGGNNYTGLIFDFLL